MKRLFYIFLIISIVMLFQHVTIRAYGVDMKVSKDEAIEIANRESKRFGYDKETMNVEATKYNTPWNEYLPKNSNEKYYVERMNKLNNREYWAVYYYPNPEKVGIGYKGGDFCIFVDANTGEIITDIRWK
jgi:hypothetical protein